jgi:hypothetical protein
MSKLAWVVTLAMLASAPAAAQIAAQTATQPAIPDLRGTWKGDSESIVLGGGNGHHVATQANEPELRSVPFTLTIDKQDGRRFSGTFASARSSSKVVAIVSRSGAILLADVQGVTNGTMLASNRMELCYLKQSPEAQIASCVELTQQPR